MGRSPPFSAHPPGTETTSGSEHTGAADPLQAQQSTIPTPTASASDVASVASRVREQPFIGGTAPSAEDADAFAALARQEPGFLDWVKRMHAAGVVQPPRAAGAGPEQGDLLLGAARAVRGTIVHFTGELQPGDKNPPVEHIEDGAIVVNGRGEIMACAPWADLKSRIPAATPLDDHTRHIIVPGFVDCHVHYPQLGMIASDGEQLLDWLQKYTFPTELKFADAQHATSVANFFLDELLRMGTTTALVFATVHPQSVDAFFTAAQQRRLRMICGNFLMDRDAPEGLLDTAESGYAESKALIERWHRQDRLLYAVTPRFAPTSTPEQLAAAGRLLRKYPDVYLHTHLSENKNEVALVNKLFPEANGYLDVYDRAGLVTERSVFAHCVHLRDDEFDLLKQRDGAIAWCSMSNMFLGSGLFPRCQAHRRGIRTGIGSDMGAGNSISVLAAMEASYKSEQLQNANIDPLSLFYHATLGGAKALRLEHVIGNFARGKEADFTVLDPRANPLIAMRMAGARTLKEKLFVLAMLRSDRVVRATYVLGHVAYSRAD